MNEDEKRLFDALETWRSRLWQEYTAKTALEWKFSYSLWAALLGAAGLVVAHQAAIGKSLPNNIWVASLLGLVVVLLHAMMLTWIHRRLGNYRRQITEVADRMRKMVSVAIPVRTTSKLSRASPVLQVCVTALLTFLLFAIVSVAGG